MTKNLTIIMKTAQEESKNLICQILINFQFISNVSIKDEI